jgi:predicted alpha/beta-fold hydrolase
MTADNAFTPPLLLRNPHIQSILNSVGPRKIRANRLVQRLNSETIILTAVDGTRLKAEYDRSTSANNQTPKGALIILLHGWEGSSKSAYQVTTANYLLKQGFDVLRLNLRDHGDTQHLNQGIFNSTLTDEVAGAIADFSLKYSYEKTFLAGFSLGANFALRIAADHGESLNLTATVGICPPVDPVNAMVALDRTVFFYEKYFFYRWSNSLKKKLEYFPEYDFAEALDSARSINDMNELFITKYTPFDSIDSYFSSYALTGDRLANLTSPTHLIASADDPIIPVADIQRINCPEQLSIEIQTFGGHCGFIKNLAAHSWIEPRLVEIFNNHL